MTALDRYVRLESDAIWRAGPDEQRRDVALSFGDATLVIADRAGRPLTHWSLPTLIRQNPDETPAIYAPDEEASELLEIADTTMIDAIEDVRIALARSRRRPGKLRHLLTLSAVALIAVLAIFWLPGALTRQTLAVVPAPKRVEIGAAILGYLQPEAGAPCFGPQGQSASPQLAARLFGPETTVKLVVLPDLQPGAITLPGGFIAIDSKMLQQANDPAVAAGYILASQAAIGSNDPLEALLDNAGLAVTFKLLTTGDIPAPILRDAASGLLTPVSPDPEVLRNLMAARQIPQAPYLRAVDQRTGSMPDFGSDPLDPATVPLVLTDSDWVALQNICNG